jgi:sugar phosphate isomerase/epimerase
MNAAGRSHLKPGQGNLDFTELFRRFYGGDQWLTVEVKDHRHPGGGFCMP